MMTVPWRTICPARVAILTITLLTLVACAPATSPSATPPSAAPQSSTEQSGEALPSVQVHVPLGSCTLDLPLSITDEEAIAQVLQAEGELVVQQAIDALMQLWHDGAMIVDAKHTADDERDDQRWLDKDAIRHRYVRLVFPGAPAVAAPKDLAVIITETDAVVTATTQIGNEISPEGDRWQLSKQGDCWVIDSLTYNLESP